MKSPRIAAVLNFLIPGAGMLYIGHQRLAVANFLVAVAVPWIWLSLVVDGVENVHYVILGIAAGSAGFAHALAGKIIRQAMTADSSHEDSNATSAAKISKN